MVSASRSAPTRLPVMLAALAFLLSPAAVSSQTITPTNNRTVSVHASNVPLGSVFRDLDNVVPFELLSIDPRVDQRPVTITLDHVSVRQAVVEILQAAAVDYAVTGSEDGQGLRVVAQEKKRTDSGDRTEMLQQTPSAELREPRQGGDEPLSAGSAAEQTEDPVAAEQRSRRLEDLFAPQPSSSQQPMGTVPLPFPGADGTPLTVIVPPNAPNNVLPFPGDNGEPLRPSATDSSNWDPSDPRLQQFNKLLAPQSKPKSNGEKP